MFDDYMSLVWSTTPSMAKWLLSLPPTAFISSVNAAFRLSSVDLKYISTLVSAEDIQKEIEWRESLLNNDENTLPPRVIAMDESSRAGFPLRLSHVDEYIAPRIALVGDAAHTVHPLAGQGLNLGLADVNALSASIQQSYNLGLDIGSLMRLHMLTLGSLVALSEYPLQRYFANHQMLGVCDKLHKLYSSENEVVKTLRSWGLEIVNELTAVKGFLLRQAS